MASCTIAAVAETGFQIARDAIGNPDPDTGMYREPDFITFNSSWALAMPSLADLGPPNFTGRC